MKKIIAIILALATCLVLVSIPASAAVATPFSDNNMKIAVVEKFDKPPYSLFLGIYNGVPPEGDPALDLFDTNGTFTIKEGAEAQVWAGVLSNSLAAYTPTGAVGYGFYVKNNTDTDQAFQPIITTVDNNLNNPGYTIFSNMEYALVSKTDGKVTTYIAPEQKHPYNAELTVQSNITVPKGFEGYVFIPFANTALVWGGGNDNKATDHMTYKAFGWSGGSTPITGGALVIDNIFFYGNVNPKDADLISISAGTEEPSKTADISTIVYAMAAMAGCGALVVLKKREK